MMSRVTYVPENYASLMAACLHVPGVEVVGLLLVDNRSLRVGLQGLGLMLAGAPRTGAALLRNMLFRDSRERLAGVRHIPLWKTQDPNGADALAWLSSLQPDLVLHLRTRSILRPEFLAIPRLGCVNVHHGILPEYRGTLCDLRALVQGRRGGFSIHAMIPAVDKGSVFARTEVADAEECARNYQTYLRLSAEKEILAVTSFLAGIAETGALPPPLKIPEGMESAWYRTPGAKEIRMWRKQGWKL